MGGQVKTLSKPDKVELKSNLRKRDVHSDNIL